MKIFTIIILSFICVVPLLANGVAIVDGKNAIYLKMLHSEISVTVENQIAVVKAKQVYKNDLGSAKVIKYAFPLPESATATSLGWLLEGVWYQASIAPTPQDTTTPGPGGEMDPDLKQYLGDTPLYYDLVQPIKADSELIIELDYVQLLPYEFGDVNFYYPNDYSLIQSRFINIQTLDFNLLSPRTINSVELLSGQPITSFTNDGNQASLISNSYETTADEDYLLKYTLSLDELGLFGFSTYIPDENIPDTLGGFFLFVAEPDPGNTTEVIQKYFTFIIDRSGSMFTGNKMEQAKNAASFIINNLNEGDKFNIVDFETNVSSFAGSHVEFNEENKNAALNYIEILAPTGLTNISGAFDVAVPQFGYASDSSANIIIFFTDGIPTVGIENISELVSHVNDLVVQTETQISLFVFGVGGDVNKQLLTQLAVQNNGFADFLEADVLEEVIIEFYLKIRSPVLLNTDMVVSPTGITEIYPDPLPNLYQGQQMIVAGRYNEAAATTITLSGGGAFGAQVSYEYDLNLTDTAVAQYQFLPKIWAKLKIEHLLVNYYILDPDSPEAENLKQQIIDLSLSFGVISPFTSFSEPSFIEEEMVNIAHHPVKYELLGNYPNPFNSSTKIQFRIHTVLKRVVTVKIYNNLGQLVRILSIYVDRPGLYEIIWDGTGQDGIVVSSGIYFYLVDFGDAILAAKMHLIK